MDLVYQSLTPQISSLPLSTPKEKNMHLTRRWSRVALLGWNGHFVGGPTKLQIVTKKVPRHLTKQIGNILHNLVGQMSLKMVSMGAAASHFSTSAMIEP